MTRGEEKRDIGEEVGRERGKEILRRRCEEEEEKNKRRERVEQEGKGEE